MNAAMTTQAPDVAIEKETGEETEPALPWCVILFNDDWHAFDEVVLQVQKATGASEELAYQITLEAHATGQAVCYSGTLVDCEKVVAVLREIRLTVKIDHY